MKTDVSEVGQGGAPLAADRSGAGADPSSQQRMPRRVVIKWMMTAAASLAVLERDAFAADGLGAARGASGAAATGAAQGYGTDPDLVKTYAPGDVWPLTFDDAQRAVAAAVCDVIIPADEKGPAASAVNVHDFIDEWISAPYPGHDADRKLVLDGLAWVDAESRKRFGNSFMNLVLRQKHAICDDICYVPNAKPEFTEAARFFTRFRDLTAGGYYTTPEGMKDIGYVGNVALATFDGPPPEALKKLGLA